MADEREFDEDGFPILRFTEEEMAKTRERMNTLVDCKALAREIMQQRPAPDPQLLASLAEEDGIDGTKTLTELEGNDMGDTHDVADEPLVHALRYVPLAQWSARDVALMLVYHHGVPQAAALAERLLRQDPMMEAEHYAGDLLTQFCATLSETGRTRAAEELVALFEERLWENFESVAAKAPISDDVRERERERLLHGRRADPGKDYFLRTRRYLKQLATVQECLSPREVLAIAEAKQLFARYRQRKSVELVPLPDLDDPTYRAKIDDADTFKFRRDTTFTIVSDRLTDGVRLVIHSASAIDHRLGVWCDSINAAKALALRDYGVTEEDWRHGPPSPPAVHR
ncbi:MAG: contact-dependent growth inhibition system immunity protein [Pseudomonadota bacterium]